MCSDWPGLGYGLTPGVEGSELYGLGIVRERVSSPQKIKVPVQKMEKMDAG